MITVIGCGGDRDREKRPIMAAIAARLSNSVILTSDNPRSEDPRAIIDEMCAGIDSASRYRVSVILDRREAISLACRNAPKGALILIAGKGHEKFQEIGGVKHPFDDVAVAGDALASRR